MKHSLLNTLPRWLLTWLFCLALDLGLSELLGVESRWWLAVAALLLWCALLAAAEHLGKFPAALLLWLIGLWSILLLPDLEKLIKTAVDLFSGAETQEGYGEAALLILSAAAVLPLSALMRFYPARAALSLGWIGLWIAAAILEKPVPRLVPAALLPLLMLTLSETIRRFFREKEPPRAWRRSLLISLLPAALLLALLPAPAEPYEYPILTSIAEKAQELWHDVETNIRYRHEGERQLGLNFNGVSDLAQVGDGTEGNGDGVIYAQFGHAPSGAVYIFGNSWDSFDGKNWNSTLRNDSAKYLNCRLDTAEHVYALWRLLEAEGSAAELSDLCTSTSVLLRCENMNVRTMLTLPDTTYIDIDSGRYPYGDGATGALFDYVQRDEVIYKTYFLETPVGTRNAVIAFAGGTEYDENSTGPRWYRVAQDLKSSFLRTLLDDANMEKLLHDRAELIYRVYLDVSGVSERAQTLALSLTKNCETDAEKAAAIAAYLRNNYSYTLSPRPVPEGENFLDTLLFESREGYCTWYATAAVLLSRSVGIPARYVQGYRCDSGGAAFVTIDAGDSHAWCECYLSGYGWVTIEATPGYADTGIGGEYDMESFSPHVISGGKSDEGPALPGGDGEADGESSAEADPEAPRNGIAPIVLFILLPVSVAAVIILLHLRRRRRYEKSAPSERLLMDMRALLRDLRGKGYPRRPDEPLRDYFARVPWRYLLASEEEAAEIAELYDRVFFALEEPTEDELSRHRAFASRFRPRTLRQWMIWLRLQ